MKKCPYCAEEIQDEAILCRYCGSSLEKTEQINDIVKDKKPNTISVKAKVKRDLERPIWGFWYFVIGFLAYFALFLIGIVLIYPIFSFLDYTNASDSAYNYLGGAIIFILYVAGAIIATRGYWGSATFFRVIGMMFLPWIPFIGQILAFYCLGKGTYMLITRQKFVESKILIGSEIQA